MSHEQVTVMLKPAGCGLSEGRRQAVIARVEQKSKHLVLGCRNVEGAEEEFSVDYRVPFSPSPMPHSSVFRLLRRFIDIDSGGEINLSETLAGRVIWIEVKAFNKKCGERSRRATRVADLWPVDAGDGQEELEFGDESETLKNLRAQSVDLSPQ